MGVVPVVMQEGCGYLEWQGQEMGVAMTRKWVWLECAKGVGVA